MAVRELRPPQELRAPPSAREDEVNACLKRGIKGASAAARRRRRRRTWASERAAADAAAAARRSAATRAALAMAGEVAWRATLFGLGGAAMASRACAWRVLGQQDSSELSTQ